MNHALERIAEARIECVARGRLAAPQVTPDCEEALVPTAGGRVAPRLPRRLRRRT